MNGIFRRKKKRESQIIKHIKRSSLAQTPVQQMIFAKWKNKAYFWRFLAIHNGWVHDGGLLHGFGVLCSPHDSFLTLSLSPNSSPSPSLCTYSLFLSSTTLPSLSAKEGKKYGTEKKWEPEGCCVKILKENIQQREKMAFPNENNSKRLRKKDYFKGVDRVWGKPQRRV